MRLYINKREIEPLKRALAGNRLLPEDLKPLGDLYERVILCELLQHNCERGKEGDEE